jgi:hypothetical protein
MRRVELDRPLPFWLLGLNLRPRSTGEDAGPSRRRGWGRFFSSDSRLSDQRFYPLALHRHPLLLSLIRRKNTAAACIRDRFESLEPLDRYFRPQREDGTEGVQVPVSHQAVHHKFAPSGRRAESEGGGEAGQGVDGGELGARRGREERERLSWIRRVEQIVFAVRISMNLPNEYSKDKVGLAEVYHRSRGSRASCRPLQEDAIGFAILW